MNKIKLKKDCILKRLLMVAMSVFFMSLGITLLQQSNFGNDPYICLWFGVIGTTGIPFGIIFMSMEFVFLIFVLFTDRSKIGIGTLANMFLVGNLADVIRILYEMVFPTPSLLWIRIIFMIIGIIVLSFGASLYFTADLGVAPYDAVAPILGNRTPLAFRWWRVITDVLCVIGGFLLGSVVGVGTVITAFFMGPLVHWFNVHLSEPFLQRSQKKTL